MSLSDREKARLLALVGCVATLENKLEGVMDVNVNKIAAGSNLIGRVDARDGDKIWSYSGIVEENYKDTNLNAGDVIIDGTPVPAGEIWRITGISFYISSTSITQIRIWVDGLATKYYPVEESSPDNTYWYSYLVNIPMQQSDYFRTKVYGATSGDVIYTRYIGWKMQI